MNTVVERIIRFLVERGQNVTDEDRALIADLVERGELVLPVSSTSRLKASIVLHWCETIGIDWQDDHLIGIAYLLWEGRYISIQQNNRHNTY